LDEGGSWRFKMLRNGMEEGGYMEIEEGMMFLA
jgi:hypothetical protein